ncbi:uncharacterized protein JCM15063_004103 [Sporobolomyces koalae]|uniref:uncharacterized protein n=1 Tax=Sporobolomyces koalae TaxID=500713 RepID=UPI00316C74E7
MPATRSLKPLLKFTLVVCLVIVLYRSFVQPRLATTTVRSVKDEPRDSRRIRLEQDDPVTRDRTHRGHEQQHQVNGNRYAGAEANERARVVQYARDREDAHLKQKQVDDHLHRANPKDQKKQVPQKDSKQIPNHVPGWIVEQERERAKGNGRLGDSRPKGVAGDSVRDTLKQELEAMHARKQMREQGKPVAKDLREGERPTKVEPVQDQGDKVYHLVDEDDELDAAQRGDSDVRGALAGQRKKGPLIQVGGAGNAAGDKGPADGVAVAGGAGGIDAVKAKGRDKWKGKGWDQRFRKQDEKEKERDERAEMGEEADGRGSTDSNGRDAEPQQTKPEQVDPAISSLAQHPLVARYLKQDISHHGNNPFATRKQAVFANSEDENAVPAEDARNKKLAPTGSSTDRHNLTVCALIPNEQRFLPEWLLYHSLLGVSRFALYDTSLPGAFGGEEIDQLADSMRQEGGGGENAPTVEELKAQVAVSNAGREGLDEKGQIRRERVRGLEEWIDKDRVEMFYMKFKHPRANHDVHALMLEDCVERFGPSSNWLAHLDVDEFLSLSTPLYGSDEPYPSPANDADTVTQPDHLYPLHDLLSSPSINSALCVPVPELNYRNLGIKELKRSQGVLETQVHRDVLVEVKETRAQEDRASLPQKTLIHTGYSKEPGVAFSGPHSCELLRTADDADDGIRDSQGNVLVSRNGLYRAQQNLPIEPLAIAHYVQRDLLDCHSKLSSVADPLSLLPKGRGSVSCEAHYLPSAAELASAEWRNDPANEDLRTVPPIGTVLEDRRMATSWAARASKEISTVWRKNVERGMRKTSKGERERLVNRVKDKVQVLSY